MPLMHLRKLKASDVVPIMEGEAVRVWTQDANQQWAISRCPTFTGAYVIHNLQTDKWNRTYSLKDVKAYIRSAARPVSAWQTYNPNRINP